MPSTEEQAEETVTELMTEGEFNLGAYLGNGGINLAEKQVTLYTDIAAQLALDELFPKIARLEDSYKGSVGGVPEDDNELNAMYAERNMMISRKWDTRLEVILRTVAPKLLNAFAKRGQAKQKSEDWTDDQRGEFVMTEFFRHAIVSISVIKVAQTVAGPLSIGAYKDFMESLPESEVDKVLATAQYLTYSIKLLDDRVDAGFPGGSIHLVGEL